MARRCDLTGVYTIHVGAPDYAWTQLSRTERRLVRLRLAARTLRSIEHKGGLDKFLLGTANGKLTDEAVGIKRRIKKVMAAA